jgi:Tetratricopeptide repeat
VIRAGLFVAATALVAAASLDSATAQQLGVDEIVERYVAARGGLDRIRAIRTLVYSGGVYREADYESPGDAFMAFARPYFRVVGNPESPGAYMEGYDGAAWEWYADPGVVVRTVGAAAGATRRGADFEGMLVDYRRKGTTVELGESADIDGRPAYRLLVALRDGYTRVLFVDAESFLVVAERSSAPVHAFGEAVTSEARIQDYRPVVGVLFAHHYVETEIATGRTLNEMQWGKIEANRDLARAWFSPPVFERDDLQSFVENLYAERTDEAALVWSYAEFRAAHPSVDTAKGVEFVGYQILKMGETDAAVALLEANARDHPDSASAAFGLGRALKSRGDLDGARTELERAVRLDPDHRRAAESLRELDGSEP